MEKKKGKFKMRTKRQIMMSIVDKMTNDDFTMFLFEVLAIAQIKGYTDIRILNILRSLEEDYESRPIPRQNDVKNLVKTLDKRLNKGV